MDVATLCLRRPENECDTLPRLARSSRSFRTILPHGVVVNELTAKRLYPNVNVLAHTRTYLVS